MKTMKESLWKRRRGRRWSLEGFKRKVKFKKERDQDEDRKEEDKEDK